MSLNEDIKNAVELLAGKNEEIYSIACNVSNVNKTTKLCDCTPIDGKAILYSVKLMSDDKKGFLLVPKDNSIVIVTMVNKYTGYVAMCSEVDEIHLNGENYYGLVKIEDLVTKLNNLENKVNTIITTYNTHTHAGVTAGFASTAVTPSVIAGTLTPTVKANLENTKVKHGNG
jgi:recombinational DNA repair protein RecR